MVQKGWRIGVQAGRFCWWKSSSLGAFFAASAGAWEVAASGAGWISSADSSVAAESSRSPPPSSYFDGWGAEKGRLEL